MKKRTLAIVLCMLLCALFVSVASAEFTKNTEVSGEITWWGAIQEESGPLEVIEHFNEIYPNIEVEYVYFKNNDAGNTKLDTALMSDEGVDVFVNYGAKRVPPRLNGGLLEDLTPYIERDGMNVIDEFGGEYLVEEGKMYALPASSIKTMIYFNKDMLDAAGLPIPDDNWTWDDFDMYMEKLSSGEGFNRVFGGVSVTDSYSMAYPSRGILGSNYFYKEDGTSNFDHPSFKWSLERRMKVQVEKKIEYDIFEQKATGVTAQDLFLNGVTASMMVSGPYLRYVKDMENYPHDFTVAFANVPRYDENTEVNYNKGSYMFDFASINSKSENKEAAWEFLKYYTTEGSMYMFKYGRGPAWKKLDIAQATEMLLNEEQKKQIDMESFNRVYLDFVSEGYNDDIFTQNDQISAVMTEEMEKCMLGEITVDEAIGNMKARADELLANAQ